MGSREAAHQLIDGLRQLEYRGYDSAGIATVDAKGTLTCLKAKGKLVNLTARVEAQGASGQCGIGHTRWATHGKPEERNAHPHCSGDGSVAVVQNGIIENHRNLREALETDGAVFVSETDTEVIPHLIGAELTKRLAAAESPSGAGMLQSVHPVNPK